jgi:hypothetical protein
MKKFLSFIVLLSISSFLSFGQTISVKPTSIKLLHEDEAQNMAQYMSKYAPSSTKAIIWSSEMTNTTEWAVSNASDATISTMWTRLADTSAASVNWKNYVGPYMGSATPMNGVYYFEGISNLINANYGVSNSRLTNAVAINTIGHPSVVIRFYQLYKGFNADSTLLEISSDNVNWKVIDVNPTISANVYAYGWKEFNVSPWAGNKAQVWVRFRFFAPASTSSGAQYGGGYGWMIDDVSLMDAQDNKLTLSRLWANEGYTETPIGQQSPISFEGEFTNSGGLTQYNVKLFGKELTTNTVLAGTNIDSIPAAVVDTAYTENFFTPSTTGDYKITSWLTSDAIPEAIFGDTLNFKITNAETFSRDNNIYYTSKWNDGDAYTVTNLYELKTNDTIFGVKLAVNLATKAGSSIKGVLYSGLGQSRILIAESDYHVLLPSEIPTSAGTAPIIITLPFTTPIVAQVDSFYWAGMTTYGGSDTVKIAVDNALIPHSGGIPQYYYNSAIFDNTQNQWFVFTFLQQAAMVIRLSFDHSIQTIGINELSNNINLFSCMPNPANNSTRISYELKNSENVTILLTDITGRTVMTLNEGSKSPGNHVADVNLTDLTSGTYFYTLKTGNSQATKKMVIVKR